MPNLVEPNADAMPPAAAPVPPADTVVPPTAAETPTPTVPEDTASQGAEMPEELIKIPAFQALFAGSPPALSYDLDDKADRPERKAAEANIDYLQQAGMGTYKTLNGQRGVIYNGLRIHPEDLAAADKAGKLSMLAPDFDAVNHAVSKSGASHPIFHVGAVPNAPPSSRSGPIAPQSAQQQALADRISGAPAPLAGSSPIVAPASAGAQKRITGARLANMAPTAPTGGSNPGQGALLAAITKPVV